MRQSEPKETEAGLLSQAHAPGLAAGEPFWKSFTRQVHALPDTVFEQLPADGASEHDPYLYGAPKRNA